MVVKHAKLLAATGFERRHQMLFHLLIVGAAWVYLHHREGRCSLELHQGSWRGNEATRTPELSLGYAPDWPRRLHLHQG